MPLYPSTLKSPDIAVLLEQIDPHADLAHRHLWLLALMRWIRGDQSSVELALSRVQLLLDVLQARPDRAVVVQAWWARLLDTVDGSTLLSDYGLASRSAFISELVDRLHRKFLPTSPETADAGELFAQVLNSAFDAQWLAALPAVTLQRLGDLLHVPAPSAPAPNNSGEPVSYWQYMLMEAITFCTSQIRSIGFSPEVRSRMRSPAQDTRAFHTLSADWDLVCSAWLNKQDLDGAVRHFKAQLDACRQATSSVYTHLEDHGISVDLVFRLRQLRERVLRIRALMDCLLQDEDHKYSAKLLAHLALVGQEQRSVRALITSNSSLLSAKVAERNSETGEHYITRNWAEYKTMLRQAAGGGGIMVFTTALKFGVMALGLSALWNGFWAGVVYALSFVVIQLLHLTVATKQPAMTAPAMAAKLKDMSAPGAVAGFVDEVTHLVRSQVAAVVGNVSMVFPLAIAFSLVWALAFGRPMLQVETAHYVLQSISLWGPSLLFAAFTGVLLFASSLIAGWVENWFVLHRLDSALRYNPSLTGLLGYARADRWAHFLRSNISGFAANISLGLMLGVVPPILGFLGVGLDVRHVTLSAGQIGVAGAVLGWDVVSTAAFWWACASVPLIGFLNVMVSFWLAFRVALRAHNVNAVGRRAVYAAIAQRLRQAPLCFFWPAREET